MKRVRLALLLLLGCGAAALVIRAVSHSAEPYYQGRSLTEWLAAYQNAPDGGVEEQKAADAIRQIGTNALPCLLQRLRRQTPKWRINAAGAATHLPEPLGHWWVVWLLGGEDGLVAATAGFDILGPAAAPAIPDLLRLMDGRDTHDIAIVALASIGDVGLPFLTEALATRTNSVALRAGAAETMGLMETRNRMVVPVLVGCLEHEQPVAVAAARTLGVVKVEPDTVVPALTNAMQRPWPNLRIAAMTSLSRFEEQARPAAPALLGRLNDAYPAVRQCATNVLSVIAPEMLPKDAHVEGKED
jgi:hypothetical protein